MKGINYKAVFPFVFPYLERQRDYSVIHAATKVL